jgi:hypothetical protein
VLQCPATEDSGDEPPLRGHLCISELQSIYKEVDSPTLVRNFIIQSIFNDTLLRALPISPRYLTSAALCHIPTTVPSSRTLDTASSTKRPLTTSPKVPFSGPSLLLYKTVRAIPILRLRYPVIYRYFLSIKHTNYIHNARCYHSNFPLC